MAPFLRATAMLHDDFMYVVYEKRMDRSRLCSRDVQDASLRREVSSAYGHFSSVDAYKDVIRRLLLVLVENCTVHMSLWYTRRRITIWSHYML